MVEVDTGVGGGTNGEYSQPVLNFFIIFTLNI